MMIIFISARMLFNHCLGKAPSRGNHIHSSSRRLCNFALRSWIQRYWLPTDLGQGSELSNNTTTQIGVPDKRTENDPAHAAVDSSARRWFPGGRQSGFTRITPVIRLFCETIEEESAV